MSEQRVLCTYGRRQGRPIKSSSKILIEQFLPTIQIQLEDDATNIDPSSFFEDKKPVVMEVGFGGGEHLYELAKHHPDINFIGCEPYIPGISSLLHHIKDENMENIRVYTGNALILLNALEDQSLSKLYLMFPDPWRKKRHHKRRFIQHDILELLHRKFVKSGTLHGATDHENYQQWIFKHLEESPLFSQLVWTFDKPESWPNTRYESKALAQGRTPVYYMYRKIEKAL